MGGFVTGATATGQQADLKALKLVRDKTEVIKDMLKNTHKIYI